MLPHAAEGAGPDAALRHLQHGRDARRLAGRAARARRLVAGVAARLSARRRAQGSLVVRTPLAPRSRSATSSPPEPRPPLHRSRGIVARLCGLFALDSLGGGFVPQTFIAYLFTRKYDASTETLAVLFFAIGILQALSFQAAVRIAAPDRAPADDGLHAPPLQRPARRRRLRPEPRRAAIALLLARFALSQMDVPTRQAYVVAVVDPSERTAAAAYTNAARTSPARSRRSSRAPRSASASARPSSIAGTLKSVYDIGLYLLFRNVDVEGERAREPATAS